MIICNKFNFLSLFNQIDWSDLIENVHKKSQAGGYPIA
jgi:hypothetical protein